MSCPNKNLKDWQQIADQIGELGAYKVFIENGEKVPYLQGREQNRFVWDVENKYKLVGWDKSENGKNVKVLKQYSESEINKIAKDISEEYVGNFESLFSQMDATNWILQVEGYPIPKSDTKELADRLNISMDEAADRLIAYREFVEIERNGDPNKMPDEIRSQIYNNQNEIEPEVTPTNETDPVTNKQKTLLDLNADLKAAMPKLSDVYEDYKMNVPLNLKGGVLRYNPDHIDWTKGNPVGRMIVQSVGGVKQNSFLDRGFNIMAEGNSEIYNQVKEEVEGFAFGDDSYLQLETLGRAIQLTSASTDIANKEQADKLDKWLNQFYTRAYALTKISKEDVRSMSAKEFKDADVNNESIIPQEEPKIAPDPVLNIEKTLSTAEERSRKEYLDAREESKRLIRARLNAMQLTGKKAEYNKLMDLLIKIDDDSNRDMNAVYQFAHNAIGSINATYKSYQDMMDRRQKGLLQKNDLETLTRWYDTLNSYTVLDHMVTSLTRDGFLGLDGKLSREKAAKLISRLNNAISKKNIILDEYNNLAPELAIKKILKYSTNVVGNTRADKMKEFARANISEYRKPGKGKFKTTKGWDDAMAKYAEDYIEANVEKLTQDSYEKLMAEVKVASKDINKLQSMLETMLDTDDVFLAAMTKAIVTKDAVARRYSKEFTDRIWKVTKKLYDKNNYTAGKTDLTKVYSFMLETSRNGNQNRTGNIIDRFHSDIWVEMEKYRESLGDLTAAQIQSKMKLWKDENMPRDDQGFRLGLSTYIKQLVKEGKMSQEDFDLYTANYTRSFRTRVATDKLFKTVDSEGGVSYNVELANLIDNWIKEHSMDYRTPIEKWENPQWKVLDKTLKENPESPEAQFYTLVTEMLDDVNKHLPFNKRRYKELPFIMKDFLERNAAGESLVSNTKDWLKDLTQRRIDSTDMGAYTDINDKPINFLPYHYNRPPNTKEHKVSYRLKKSDVKESKAKARGKEFKKEVRLITAPTAEEAIQTLKMNVPDIDESSINVMASKDVKWTDKDQSYDLAGVFSNYHKMAQNYIQKADILAEVEVAKRIARTREYEQTDSMGRKITKAFGIESTRNATKEGADANIAYQFENFVANSMYGQGKVDEGSWDVMGWKFDKAKMLDGLGKHASFTMLGLNLMQGFSNVTLGEVQQVIESIAGDKFTTKDLAKATGIYYSETSKMLGDIANHEKSSVITHLNAEWDVLNEYTEGKFVKGSRFSQMMDTSVLFFMSNAGEHFMQSRVMVAMLRKVDAIDKDGNRIGNMYDQYSVKDGILTLSDKVDLKKSKWGDEQRALYGEKIKRLLAQIHGEYSDIAKNSVQRYAVGRMGMMFRKFIMPGFKRRWYGRQYNEFLETHTEGSYSSILSFIGKSVKETQALGFGAFTENWAELTKDERANLIRGVSEFGFAILFGLLSTIALTLKEGADDDKERKLYAMAAILSLRVGSELQFFYNPSEAFNIVQNPAVVFNLVEDVIKLSAQIFDPFDTYERGSWKGYPKILKTLYGITPIVKQGYKLKNIEDTLVFYAN